MSGQHKRRTVCAVPGCQRWTAQHDEYLCPDHWRGVPKAHRRAYSRAWNQELEKGTDPGRPLMVTTRGYHRIYRLWRACIRMAILNAGGLRG